MIPFGLYVLFWIWLMGHVFREEPMTRAQKRLVGAVFCVFGLAVVALLALFTVGGD
jgi:hypothetical protein